jgi:Fe-S cluster assembly iron-binding protein IscA
MIEVTPRARRALAEVLQDNPRPTIRVFVEGFG